MKLLLREMVKKKSRDHEIEKSRPRKNHIFEIQKYVGVHQSQVTNERPFKCSCAIESLRVLSRGFKWLGVVECGQ